MSECTVQTVTIRCGGGCGLICTSRGKKRHCWGGCSSVLKTHPAGDSTSKEEAIEAIQKAESIHFVVKQMKFSNVAKFLGEVLPHSVVAPEGREEELVDRNFEGKLEDLVRELKLKKT
jgi:hypothetical protein